MSSFCYEQVFESRGLGHLWMAWRRSGHGAGWERIGYVVEPHADSLTP